MLPITYHQMNLNVGIFALWVNERRKYVRSGSPCSCHTMCGKFYVILCVVNYLAIRSNKFLSRKCHHIQARG